MSYILEQHSSISAIRIQKLGSIQYVEIGLVVNSVPGGYGLGQWAVS